MLASAAAGGAAGTKAALHELGKALKDPDVPLCSVNLEMNCLTADEASVLIPYLEENKKVQVLTVDASLPSEIYAMLCRTGEAAKKPKKKKGGSAKKKK